MNIIYIYIFICMCIHNLKQFYLNLSNKMHNLSKSSQNKTRQNGHKYHRKQTATNSVNDKFTIYAQMKMHYANLSSQESRQISDNNRIDSNHRQSSQLRHGQEEQDDSKKISRLKQILKSVLYQEDQQSGHMDSKQATNRYNNAKYQPYQLQQRSKQLSKQQKTRQINNYMGSEATLKNISKTQQLQSSLKSQNSYNPLKISQIIHSKSQLPVDSNKSLNYNHQLDILKRNLIIISQKNYNKSHKELSVPYGLKSGGISKKIRSQQSDRVHECASQILPRKTSAAHDYYYKHPSTSVSLPISNNNWPSEKQSEQPDLADNFNSRSSYSPGINSLRNSKNQPQQLNLESINQTPASISPKIIEKQQEYYNTKLSQNRGGWNKNGLCIKQVEPNNHLTDRIVISKQICKGQDEQIKMQINYYKQKSTESTAKANWNLQKQIDSKIQHIDYNKSKNYPQRILAPKIQSKPSKQHISIQNKQTKPYKKQLYFQKNNRTTGNGSFRQSTKISNFPQNKSQSKSKSKSRTKIQPNKSDKPDKPDKQRKNMNISSSFEQRSRQKNRKFEGATDIKKMQPKSEVIVQNNSRRPAANDSTPINKIQFIPILNLPGLHRASICKIVSLYSADSTITCYSASADYRVGCFKSNLNRAADENNSFTTQITYPYRHRAPITDLILDTSHRCLVSCGKDQYLKISILSGQFCDEQSTLSSSACLNSPARKLVNMDYGKICVGLNKGLLTFDIQKNSNIRQLDYQALSRSHSLWSKHSRLLESKQNILVGNQHSLHLLDFRCNNPFQDVATFRNIEIQRWLIDHNSDNYYGFIYNSTNTDLTASCNINIINKNKPSHVIQSVDISCALLDYYWEQYGNNIMLLTQNGTISRFNANHNINKQTRRNIGISSVCDIVCNLPEQFGFFQANKIENIGSQICALGNKKGDLTILGLKKIL